jgi:uncharacterized coiled-coil protein SlyX
MCGNRVEELESRVKELEASVEGLTDELVECKVRLRELEDAVDEELGFVPEVSTDESAEGGISDSSVGAEMVDDTEAAPFGENTSTEEADTTKTEADDSESKTEESDSDIIIA